MAIVFADLQIGDTAKILGFNPGKREYQQRLLAMGLVPNRELTLVRRAPLGDPIEIRVQQLFLCLRQQEGAILQLERVGSSVNEI
jgi:ferrous iron transport protein A